MATKPEEILVVRHTWDKAAKQWVNVIRKVTKDDKYKNKGTDPYGNQYHDTEVDFNRDYSLLKKVGVDMPMGEFRQIAHAAFGFGQEPEKEALHVKAMEHFLMGQLSGKRASAEASSMKPSPEKQRRMRLAGGMATGSEAYARGLTRNSEAGWEKAHGAAERHKLLGEIQGMIGQEPGGDTRLKTLTPLLVGYIRNGTPEQIKTLANAANVGDLDAVLKAVGAEAKGWEQDPNMQQYPFAAAANRYTSPTYKEDLAEQQEEGKMADVDQRQTVNPVYEPVGSPSQDQQQAGQQGQDGTNTTDTQQQPTTQGQGTPNAPWTAPSDQQYKPAQQQPQTKPGDYGGSLGAMASNWGLAQRQIMFPYPRDPGIPPKMSDYGAYIAAPTNQAALSQAFNEYSDIVKYYKSQSSLGMIEPKIAQIAISQAEDAYKQVNDRLLQDANIWKARLLKESAGDMGKDVTNATRVNNTYTFPDQDIFSGKEENEDPNDDRPIWEKRLDMIKEGATEDQRNEFVKLGAQALGSRAKAKIEEERNKDMLRRAQGAPHEMQKIHTEVRQLLKKINGDINWDTDIFDADSLYKIATDKSAIKTEEDELLQMRLRELLGQYMIWNQVYDMLQEAFPDMVDEEAEARVAGPEKGEKFSVEADDKLHKHIARHYHNLQKLRYVGEGLIGSKAARKYEQKQYERLGITTHEQFLFYMDTGLCPKKDGQKFYDAGGPKGK